MYGAVCTLAVIDGFCYSGDGRRDLHRLFPRHEPEEDRDCHGMLGRAAAVRQW